MEQKSLLTKFQQKLLAIIIAEPYLIKNYYWTGGTALTEIYLRHRESYDIDLFTEDSEVHLPSISKFIHKAMNLLKAKDVKHTHYYGLESFTFILPGDSELKIDFNFYPHLRIEVGKKYHRLAVDSLIDIATNKVHTIFMRPRGRDYIDLYFILKLHPELSLEKLISLADAKFDWHIDPLQLGEQLLRVVKFTEEPKMFLPYKRQDMEKFILNLASDLKSQILVK